MTKNCLFQYRYPIIESISMTFYVAILYPYIFSISMVVYGIGRLPLLRNVMKLFICGV